MQAANIAVDFPNPCVDLPLDRSGNGWSNLGPNDDGSAGNVPIPFVFSLFGTTYSSLWVNNNGNISFDGPKSSFRQLDSPMPKLSLLLLGGLTLTHKEAPQELSGTRQLDPTHLQLHGIV